MDLPEEILAKILSHLRTEVYSIFDLRVAFTCKALYREFEPLIKEAQTTLLLDALEGGLLTCWPRPGTGPAGESVFLPSLQGEDQETLRKFFNTRWNLELIVVSSSDVDLIWSLHAHLQQCRKLGRLIFDRLTLTFESDEVEWRAGYSLGTSYNNVLEATTGEGNPSLVHSRMAEDRERLSHALRAFSLLAVTLVDGEINIEHEFQELPEERALTLADLEPFDNTSQVAAVPDARTSKLTLNRVPSPPNFPLQNLDAVIGASCASLCELSLLGCFSRGMSDELWNAILRRWSFAQLTRLIIKDMTIPLAPLINFLQHNPTITTATFKSCGFPSTPAERLKSSYLCDLTATPETLLPLFRNTPVEFSSLKTLWISQNFSDEWTEDACEHFMRRTLDDVTTILLCVSTAAPSLQSLSLEFEYSDELRKWIDSVTPHAVDGDGAAVAADAPKSPLAEALGRLHKVDALNFTVWEDPDNERWTGGISPPYIYRGPPYIYIKPGPVVDFVAAFPALKTAHLDYMFYRPGEPDEYRVSYDDFWPEMSKIWTKAGSALERVEMRGIGWIPEWKRAIWVRGSAEPEGGFSAFPVKGDTYLGAKPKKARRGKNQICGECS